MELIRYLASDKIRIDHTKYEATYDVYFDPSHIIYKAHFPDQPVTPGVCIIQMITELASDITQQKLTLECAKNVKFLSLLIPSNETPVRVELKLECQAEQDSKHWVVKAVVQRGIVPIAKLSLIYAC